MDEEEADGFADELFEKELQKGEDEEDVDRMTF